MKKENTYVWYEEVENRDPEGPLQSHSIKTLRVYNNFSTTPSQLPSCVIVSRRRRKGCLLQTVRFFFVVFVFNFLRGLFHFHLISLSTLSLSLLSVSLSQLTEPLLSPLRQLVLYNPQRRHCLREVQDIAYGVSESDSRVAQSHSRRVVVVSPRV